MFLNYSRCARQLAAIYMHGLWSFSAALCSAVDHSLHCKASSSQTRQKYWENTLYLYTIHNYTGDLKTWQSANITSKNVLLYCFKFFCVIKTDVCIKADRVLYFLLDTLQSVHNNDKCKKWSLWNGYRRRSCTSKTAKIHRFVRFVIYCFITTCSVAFYWACSDDTVHYKSDETVNPRRLFQVLQ